MNLFSSQSKEPLAARMRPRKLEEFVGQEHILGKGRLLRRAIQADRLSSVILYGPPGTGKTTLAMVIANSTKSYFTSLNAVLSGVKELREEIEEAKERYSLYEKKTILFVDEVHRWNKSQQDALLPWVENGTFVLIGATTENPFFEVNSALVSRSRIFRLLPLNKGELEMIAKNALSDKERGYGDFNIEFEKGALEHLVDISSGDARTLLNAIEIAVETADNFPPKENESIYITKSDAEESIQKRAILYDKEGEYHFDVISAFIKSIRGSDTDASLYYLAKMVEAGEDPKFIFRRMLIAASEDIGMADPFAVAVVNQDAEAFDRVGLPEGRYHLAHAAIYLSLCPKSNSVMAFFDALSDVREKRTEVPSHLKDPSRDSAGFSHGKGYLYPHSYKEHWVSQQYLPSALKGRIYYRPTDIGFEGKIRSVINERREAIIESAVEEENFTYSPGEIWRDRAVSGRSEKYLYLRNELYKSTSIPRHANTLVLNAGTGFLVWPLLKMSPEGITLCQCEKDSDKDIITHLSSELDYLVRPVVKTSDINSFFSEIEKDLKFSLVAAKNILTKLCASENILLNIKSVMVDNADLCLIEIIPSLSSRLSDFAFSKKGELKRCESKAYKESPLSSWKEEDMKKQILKVFPNSSFKEIKYKEERVISKTTLLFYKEKIYKDMKTEDDEFVSLFPKESIEWESTVLIVNGKA